MLRPCHFRVKCFRGTKCDNFYYTPPPINTHTPTTIATTRHPTYIDYIQSKKKLLRVHDGP